MAVGARQEKHLLRRKQAVIHGLIIGQPCDVLGPNLVCADEQNPRNAGLFLKDVKLLRATGDGLIGEYQNSEYLLLLCDGCLESIIRQLLPTSGLVGFNLV